MEDALKNISRREKSNAVVVRVKRRRDQIAPSSICIVDSSKRKEGLKSSMANLSTETTTTENVSKKRRGNFAVFHLVDTVLTESKEDQKGLDHETVSCMKKRSRPNNNEPSKETSQSNNPIPNTTSKPTPKPANTVWVTKGTKVVKSAEYEDVFLVDVHVNDGRPGSDDNSGTHTNNNTNNNDNNTPNKNHMKATKIFSPITKQLDSAISSSYKSGDFSAILDIVTWGCRCQLPTCEN